MKKILEKNSSIKILENLRKKKKKNYSLPWCF